KALATGRPSSETAELDTVTETEAMPLLRRASTHVFGLGIGTVIPMADDTEPLPGISLFWLYDARNFLADVTLQFHAREGRGDVSAGLGVYYPLTRSDLAPYVGGGVRYAATHYTEGSGGNGLQLYAALGLLQGRLGSVQLRAQLELFVDTFSQGRAL